MFEKSWQERERRAGGVPLLGIYRGSGRGTGSIWGDCLRRDNGEALELRETRHVTVCPVP